MLQLHAFCYHYILLLLLATETFEKPLAMPATIIEKKNRKNVTWCCHVNYFTSKLQALASVPVIYHVIYQARIFYATLPLVQLTLPRSHVRPNNDASVMEQTKVGGGYAVERLANSRFRASRTSKTNVRRVTKTLCRPKIGFIYTSRKMYYWHLLYSILSFMFTSSPHVGVKWYSKWDGSTPKPYKWYSLSLYSSYLLLYKLSGNKFIDGRLK